MTKTMILELTALKLLHFSGMLKKMYINYSKSLHFVFKSLLPFSDLLSFENNPHSSRAYPILEQLLHRTDFTFCSFLLITFNILAQSLVCS